MFLIGEIIKKKDPMLGVKSIHEYQTGDIELFKVITERRSIRRFKQDVAPDEMLAIVLWN
jgi:hypothetical protein